MMHEITTVNNEGKRTGEKAQIGEKKKNGEVKALVPTHTLGNGDNRFNKFGLLLVWSHPT